MNTCHCPAYQFPHRSNGGDCEGLEHVCLECEQATTVHTETERTPYEFWGQRGIHTERLLISDCCHGAVEEVA